MCEGSHAASWLEVLVPTIAKFGLERCFVEEFVFVEWDSCLINCGQEKSPLRSGSKRRVFSFVRDTTLMSCTAGDSFVTRAHCTRMKISRGRGDGIQEVCR